MNHFSKGLALKHLKKIILSSLLIFFTSCGTDTQNSINPNNGFDMWEYMTSTSNYEVGYVIYENNVQTTSYTETHKQYGNEFDRISDYGTTSLYLGSNIILIKEPNSSIDVIRYLDLGDQNIFQSSSIEICTLDRFYPKYETRGYTFYNVLQVKCTMTDGVYQELYYGYNEGIVAIYEKNKDMISEYIKTQERAIF